jgi:hypothetical protein
VALDKLEEEIYKDFAFHNNNSTIVQVVGNDHSQFVDEYTVGIKSSLKKGMLEK